MNEKMKAYMKTKPDLHRQTDGMNESESVIGFYC